MPKPIPGYGGSVQSTDVPPLVVKTSINVRPVLPSGTNHLRDRFLAAQQKAAEYRAQVQQSEGQPVTFGSSKRTTDGTAYTEMTRAGFVKSAADVEPRHRPVQIAVSDATRECPVAPRSLQHESSVGFVHQPEDAASFFSRVRKAEQADDNVRFSENHITTRCSAMKHVRNVAIKDRRETDEAFVPPKSDVERVLPAKRTTWTGAIPAGSAAAAQCVLTPPSSYAHDYHSPAELSRTVEAELGATLGSAPRTVAVDQALVHASATTDLFSGTAKVKPDIVSGFMGHVPASSANVERMNGPADMLRHHAKSHCNIVLGPRLIAKLRLGDSTPERRSKTVTGFYLEQSAQSKEEAAMNRRDHHRPNAVRGFFSAGVGEADPVLADQFCVRYRPLEGLMKHGPLHSHSWISDKDLRLRHM